MSQPWAGSAEVMWPNPVPPLTCRSCRAMGRPEHVVLDLGEAPAADHFPLPGDPLPDPAYPLSMWCCPKCGLAQLTEDETSTSEPRAVEPEALRLQAADAVRSVVASGLLKQSGASTVAEFTSPHGGSWTALLTAQGLVEAEEDDRADVVADSFGLMHEPDQRHAMRQRVDRLSGEGLLLLQFHSLESILQQRQWNALRHGHFAYFSLTALLRLMQAAGLLPLRALEFPLYGGTVLLAAARATSELVRRSRHQADHVIAEILRREAELAIDSAESLRALQDSADLEAGRLRRAMEAAAVGGRRVYGYGAASRAVALLSRAELTPRHLIAVADASVEKQGRRLPATRIPVISPAELVLCRPDVVLLLLPDLLPEVTAALPELSGRWRTGTEL